MEETLTILAHGLLAAPFAASSVEKTLNRTAGLKEVEALERRAAIRVPAGLVLWSVIAVQLSGAVLLMIPQLSAAGAMVLIAFLAPTTVVAHPFWRVPREERATARNHFLLNAGLMGGLLLVAGGAVS